MLAAIRCAVQRGDYVMNNHGERTTKNEPTICVTRFSCTCGGCNFKAKAVQVTGGYVAAGGITVWTGGEHTGRPHQGSASGGASKGRTALALPVSFCPILWCMT